MDKRQTRGEWMWFVASAKWNVGVRGVLYSQKKVLVPLLREEVPFSYEDVEKDVVFLWDPSTGMALATERRKAVVVSAPVPPGDSAVALYGDPPKDEGYCYRLVTGEQVDLGEYPTVGQLAANGVVDKPGVTYTEQVVGVYHCRSGDDGLAFSELPREGVVGGSSVIAGYMLLGITAAAYLSVKGVKPLFDGMCVSAAAEVDLAVAPDIANPVGPERPVRWFGYRQLESGFYLNMGLVTMEQQEKALPDVVLVDVPSGDQGVVYWNATQNGVLRTRARMARGFKVPVDTGGGLAGLYVYVVTRVPMPDTSPYAIKYVGATVGG